jgi:hypothetical protein
MFLLFREFLLTTMDDSYESATGEDCHKSYEELQEHQKIILYR